MYHFKKLTMKKIIYILSILVITITSCSDDFVELAPENFLNTEDFYKTSDDFNSAVIAAYAKLQSQVSSYFELVEWRSDNLNLNAGTSGAQDRFNINKFQETSANGIIQDVWASFYNGIFRCNVITDRIGGANFDETLKKQYEAEARFIRAITYFNIVRYWGDAPIVLNEVSAETSLQVGRSPASEVYAAIEDDLNFAMQNLPSSHGSSGFGRATSGAARAYLGKVLLTQGKHAEASSTLNSISGYSLLGNVADVFDTGNKTNNEIIFSIRFDKNVAGEGHGLWFAISDISTSPLTPKLVNAYNTSDARKSLIDYQSEGTLLVPSKFFDTQSSSTNQYGNDYILMRYADVVLMQAEALNEQGYQPNGQAFSLLNEVRNRAGLTTPLTATDLPDQQSFRNAVLNERFLEFPLEGQRWFDLIRTGKATSEISSGIGLNIQGYQFLYPVPQSEIEKINNTSIFGQNAGY